MSKYSEENAEIVIRKYLISDAKQKALLILKNQKAIIETKNEALYRLYNDMIILWESDDEFVFNFILTEPEKMSQINQIYRRLKLKVYW